MLLVWPLVGALIGVLASQKRGFSLAIGIIGGLLLGPLAFLLYFVSGITGKEFTAVRRCHHCKEVIHPDATICKHCKGEVRPAAPLRPRSVA